MRVTASSSDACGSWAAVVPRSTLSVAWDIAPGNRLAADGAPGDEPYLGLSEVSGGALGSVPLIDDIAGAIDGRDRHLVQVVGRDGRTQRSAGALAGIGSTVSNVARENRPSTDGALAAGHD